MLSSGLLRCILLCVCVRSGSGAVSEADGSVGLQRPGTVEAPPGGKSGNCSLRPSTCHTDAAGAAGKHIHRLPLILKDNYELLLYTFIVLVITSVSYDNTRYQVNC